MEELDRDMREQADRRAAEGTKLAREAGLDATPRTRAQESATADAILSEAQAVGAEAIVIGSRGLTGVRSLLLGSVSHAVMQRKAGSWASDQYFSVQGVGLLAMLSAMLIASLDG